MRVAVLGCGPAGLVAAYAAEQAGASVRIFSKARKSEMFGAQYLHEPIPGIPAGNQREISYRLQGSIGDYRIKVYGPGYSGPVSPDDLETNHMAWDIRDTYNQLWSLYGPDVIDVSISPSWVGFNTGGFDAILSTVPLPVICANARHVFTSQEILAMGDAPERGQFVCVAANDLPDGTVICNGRQHPSWYRASKIFGYATMEWSLKTAGAIAPSNASRVKKPLRTNCDCWPGITRLGRYGRWQKGVLVHHAYREAQSCLANL